MTNSNIPSILKQIMATKQHEVNQAASQEPFENIKQRALKLYKSQSAPRRGFAAALHRLQKAQKLAIIAEIKKASPSKGVINHSFDPVLFAQQYAAAGAACLSVLTDVDYFQGHNDYLIAAHKACALPILRKDFIISPYQVYESYLLGADCILLIMACLDDDTVLTLHSIASALDMDVLIEIHSEAELQRALALPDADSKGKGHNIYGINNRDLNTFQTDLSTSLKLKSLLLNALQKKTLLEANSAANMPKDDQSPLIVTESGIHNTDDIKLMLDNGISNFLIGEQFMKTKHPGNTLQALIIDSVNAN